MNRRCPNPEHIGENPQPADNFYRDKTRKDGVSSWCKKCHCRNVAKYRTPEKTAAQRERDTKRNTNPRARLSKAIGDSRRKGYCPPNVTEERLAADMANPNKVCGGCHNPLGDDFDIEHCHLTGKYRGLWHGRCNLVAGMSGDDPELLRTIANSLAGHR